MPLAVTAACGKALLRTDVVLVLLTFNPRSPLDPAVLNVATVTAAPKLAPWSVDLRIWIRSGEPLAKSNTYTVWSGPTVTYPPWLPPRESGALQVLPPSVERVRYTPASVNALGKSVNTT